MSEKTRTDVVGFYIQKKDGLKDTVPTKRDRLDSRKLKLEKDLDLHPYLPLLQSIVSDLESSSRVPSYKRVDLWFEYNKIFLHIYTHIHTTFSSTVSFPVVTKCTQLKDNTQSISVLEYNRSIVGTLQV